MKEVFEFHTLRQLSDHLVSIMPEIVIRGSFITAKPHGGDDHRVQPTWKDTHLLLADGCVIGYIEGSLPERGPGD